MSVLLKLQINFSGLDADEMIFVIVAVVVAVAAAASSGSVGSAQMLKQIRVHDA